MVELFERWALERLADGFSLEEAARATATSKHMLARRLQHVMGKSPLFVFPGVGYADGVTLRALLRRRLGREVRELRPRQ